jgi:hypothetical protein
MNHLDSAEKPDRTDLMAKLMNAVKNSQPLPRPLPVKPAGRVSAWNTAFYLLAFTLAVSGFNFALYSQGFFSVKPCRDAYCADASSGQIRLDLSGLSAGSAGGLKPAPISAASQKVTDYGAETASPSVPGRPALEESLPAPDSVSDTGFFLKAAAEDGPASEAMFQSQYTSFEVVLWDAPAGQFPLAKTGAQALLIE